MIITFNRQLKAFLALHLAFLLELAPLYALTQGLSGNITRIRLVSHFFTGFAGMIGVLTVALLILTAAAAAKPKLTGAATILNLALLVLCGWLHVSPALSGYPEVENPTVLRYLPILLCLLFLLSFILLLTAPDTNAGAKTLEIETDGRWKAFLALHFIFLLELAPLYPRWYAGTDGRPFLDVCSYYQMKGGWVFGLFSAAAVLLAGADLKQKGLHIPSLVLQALLLSANARFFVIPAFPAFGARHLTLYLLVPSWILLLQLTALIWSAACRRSGERERQ